jgi:hypothetical protein
MPYKYPSLRTTPPVAGYYARLDAGAAASDQFTADGAQDGTLTNGASRAGSPLAYSFDGVNDYITIPHNAALNPGTGAFAISCWINPTNVNQFGIISQKRMASGAVTDVWSVAVGGDTWLGTTGKKVGIVVIFNGTINARAYDTTNDVVDGNFHHVLFCWSGSSATIYVDGVSVAITERVAAGSISSCTPDGPMRFGTNVVSGGNFYSGLLDDFLYLPYVPSATQAGYFASQRGAIYQLAASGGPINGQSLIRPAGSAQQQLLIQGATT